MYNKEDARNLYFSVVKDGLWMVQKRIERLLRSEQQYKAKCKETNKPYLNEHHYIFELERSLRFLKILEKDYKHLFHKIMVGSGSVNNGESWGDYYQMFPINGKHNEQLIELFNKYQKETPFGIFKDLNKLND